MSLQTPITKHVQSSSEERSGMNMEQTAVWFQFKMYSCTQIKSKFCRTRKPIDAKEVWQSKNLKFKSGINEWNRFPVLLWPFVIFISLLNANCLMFALIAIIVLYLTSSLYKYCVRKVMSALDVIYKWWCLVIWKFAWENSTSAFRY